MKPLDPRLIRHARGTLGYLAGCTALGTMVAVLVLVQAHLLAAAIAGVSEGTLEPADMRPLLVALAVVLAVRAVLAWAQEGLSALASAGVKSRLRRLLLERVLRLGPSWLSGEHSSSLVTLVTKGLDALDPYFARYLPQLVLAVVVPVVVLVQLVSLDLVAAGTVALTLPLIPVFMALIGWVTQARTRRRWRTQAIMAHHFADVVAGLPTLKLFNRAKAQAESVRRISEAHRGETMRTLRVAFLSSLALELLATLSVALVAVGIGVRVVEGGMDLRTALVVLILAPEAYLPLRLVGTHFHASADGMAAAEEAFRVLDAKEPVGRGSAPVPDLSTSSLRVEGVSVTYADRSAPALDDARLELRAGRIVALVGASGSGKSTLVEVLLGFRAPDGGRVLVGERDLFDIDPAAWLQKTAWVPQRPRLLAGTVAGNVWLGAGGGMATRPSGAGRHGEPEIDDDACRRALDRAGAGGLALDRPMGTDGAGLSVGEQRRVAVARALLRAERSAPVLALWDEPSAGLDEGTERAVLGALEWLRDSGHVVLVVAHRPALRDIADQVVRLGSDVRADDGEGIPA